MPQDPQSGKSSQPSTLNSQLLLAGDLLCDAGMIKNSFIQKVFITLFWGVCAAGLIQFYKHMIWQANEDINGEAAVKAIYGDSRQVTHTTSKNSVMH